MNTAPLPGTGYAVLQRFMREKTGIALDDDKLYLVEDRLRSVLRDANILGFDELAKRLSREPASELASTVAESLTINETSFFRDRALFTALTERLLPALVAARAEKRRLRIWCAGCSTGQEPYSLAMLIDEQSRLFAGWQVDIVATDLSRAAVNKARHGTYSQFEVQRGLPVKMLLRHFDQRGDSWVINDRLRARIVFREWNLMTPFQDLGGFDLIFCRNVLIYFDVATKRVVLKNLAGALAAGGRLVLGAAERVGGLSEVFHPVQADPFIFTKD